MEFWMLLVLVGVAYLLWSHSRLAKRVDALELRLQKPRVRQPSLEKASEPKTPNPKITAASEPRAEPPSVQEHDSWKAPAEPLNIPFLNAGLSWLKRYFTEGNVIVRVGVVVLFFGVAFLLRYAHQRSALPVELRLMAVGLLGVALLALGVYLRHRRRTYALILQGGGIGILYMIVYAALRLFQLLPPGGALVVMLLLVIATALAAVRQNAPAMAVLAVTGGFLAPVLTASGSGSHWVLFSYYALLNMGIVLIAWTKAWRALNLVGFLFTFVIGTAWGHLSYSPTHYASAQAFLILFFLFYVLVALLFAQRQPPNLKGYVDGTLVFGTPLIGFGLQAALVADMDYGLAWSSALLGVLYGVLAGFCWRLGSSHYRLLREAYLALSVVFISLSVPFALQGEWIVMTWALEGAALLWVSVRQQRQLGVAFAVLLQIGAGLVFLGDIWALRSGWPVINPVSLSGVALAGAALYSSYALSLAGAWLRGWLRALAPLLFFWGWFWWLFNGALEVLEFVPSVYAWGGLLTFFAGSWAMLGWLEGRLGWHQLRFAPVGLLAFMGLLLIVALAVFDHPLDRFGWAGWTALLLVLYRLLFLRDDAAPLPERWLPGLHVGAWWLLVVLLTGEAYWLGQQFEAGDDWASVLQVGALLILIGLPLSRLCWPWRRYEAAYVGVACVPMVLFLAVWSLVDSPARAADFSPLPYFPLLNPLDLAQALVLGIGALWVRTGNRLGLTWLRVQPLHATLGFVGFVWLTAVLLRGLHHWANVPYEALALWQSSLAQSSVSVFWTLVGLIGVYVAARWQQRSLWLSAAALLGVTVLKLFLVDWRDSDTLETILAFIAVGVLLLAVGYLSPMPPKRNSVTGERSAELKET